MTRTCILSACCLLASCDGTRPLRCTDWVEAGGLSICLAGEVHPSTVEMVGRIVSIVGEEVDAEYGTGSDVASGLAARGTVVETIIGKHIVYGCREIGTSGAYVCDDAYGGLMEYVSHTITMHHPASGCFGGLLAHEVMHSVAYHEIDGHNLHDTPGLFGDVGTVEGRVRRRITDEVSPLCGKDL